MPYSFIQIEKEKTRSIYFVMLFLILFYVSAFFGLWIIVKVWLFSRDILSGNQPLFSGLDVFLVLMAATLVAGFQWSLTRSSLIKNILDAVGAIEVNPNDQHEKMFSNIIEELSIATGGLNIRGVVVHSAALNAFAVSDDDDHSVIGITKGLLTRCTRAQIEAVVGHEAGHILRGDSFSTAFISSLFSVYEALAKGSEHMIASSSSSYSSRRGSNVAWLIFVYLFLSCVNVISRLLNMFISREREFRADAIAVRLTRDPLSLAQALYIISNRWRGAGLAWTNLDAIFIMHPRRSALDESLGLFSDLFSTHPPVKARLKVLLDLAKTSEEELQTSLRSIPKDEVKLEEFFGPRVVIDKAEPKTNCCPKCTVLLQPLNYEGQEIFCCQQCYGVLVKEDNLATILHRRSAVFNEEIKAMAETYKAEMHIRIKNRGDLFSQEIKFQCPLCHSKMARRFFNVYYHVQTDKCLNCGAVWLDRYELEILQCLAESLADQFKSPQKS